MIARLAALTLIPVAAFTAPAPAETSPRFGSAAQSVDAARSQVEDFARAIDTNGNMSIERTELQAAADQIFPSADTDASGDLTRAEFLGWEYGLADMAAFRGRHQGYDAAMGVVFDLFDRDDDQAIARAEFDKGLERSMAYADSDGDGAMNLQEFYSGFFINVALRNAMVDD